MSATVACSSSLSTIFGSSDRTIRASVPSVRKELAANDLIAHHPLDQAVGSPPLAARFQGTAAPEGRRSAERLARGEHRDNAARPVDELQVDDERAQLLDRVALEQHLPSNDNQHVVFARRKFVRTCSYCLNSGEFERKSWPSESSTLILSIPRTARMPSASAIASESSGRAERDEPEPFDAERDGMRSWVLGLGRPDGPILQIGGFLPSSPVGYPTDYRRNINAQGADLAPAGGEESRSAVGSGAVRPAGGPARNDGTPMSWKRC